MKSFLIICKTAPFANMIVAETIELAMGLASFEQKVGLLFTEEGLLHLIPDQNASLIKQKTFTKAYKGLDLFGIEEIFVDANALRNFNITAPNNYKLVTTDQISNLISQYDCSICV